MKLALVAMVGPRVEFPFIREWLEYNVGIGVDRFYLGEQYSEHVLARKPNKDTYSFHLSDEEISEEWEVQIGPYRDIVKSITLPKRGCQKSDVPLQRKFIMEANKRSRLDGYDWTLCHDVDEFVICKKDLKTYLGELDVDTVYMKQRIFDSRWNGRVPKPVSCVKCYHPEIISQSKFITKLEETGGIGPHKICSNNFLEADHNEIRYHHFRGVAMAMNKKINAIKSFTAYCTNSLEI